MTEALAEQTTGATLLMNLKQNTLVAETVGKTKSSKKNKSGKDGKPGSKSPARSDDSNTPKSE